MKKSIYILSGLGADERVFQNLELSSFSPTYIKWITPSKNESISSFASRIVLQINSQNPILIGLSFGGIIAIEIAKLIPVEKVILISSAKTKNNIPFYFRWAGSLYLHKLLPAHLLKKTNIFSYWLFGCKTNEEKNLLRQILTDTDPFFLHWAINEIARWNNEVLVDNAISIHGTNDKILPFSFSNSDFPIQKGGHLMVLSNSKQIELIIYKIV